MGEIAGHHQTDIVIVGHNHAALTDKCARSVQRNTLAADYQITYVDNGSEPPVALHRSLAANVVLLPTNTGYCRGNNIGIAMSLLSDSEYVLLLNNDCQIPEGDVTWLERLMRPMLKDNRIGAVGAVSDTVFGNQRRTAAGDRQREYNAPFHLYANCLIGFCLLIRKTALEQVGLLDERFDPDGNYSDFDYSIRLRRAGWTLAIAESVWIHHVGGATQKDFDYRANLERNQRKLFEKWDRDALKLVGL